jgi:hemolysin-activating ACP:hemolysin acyltransferase
VREGAAVFGSRKKEAAPGAPTAVKPNIQRAQPANSAAPQRESNAPGIQAQSGDIKASEEAQRRAAIAIRQSLAFAQIISVLMRSPHYKHYTLGDLEWLVLPPLLTGQFSIAEAGAKEGGPKFPVAVVLWASVSAEVDKRLSENLAARIRLRPDEWRSGDILWLVDALGDGRIVTPLLKRLGESVWKGREVKTQTVGEGGKPQIKRLSDRLAVTPPKGKVGNS